MTRIWLLILTTALVSGCTGKLEDKMDALHQNQDTLQSRLADLEQQNSELRKQLETQSSAMMAVQTLNAADDIRVSSTSLPSVAASSEPADVADRIVALVQQTVESTVDQRIAEQIGTADDIEAIFTEVVGDEMAAKEEEKRQEQLDRRRKQSEEWDLRSLDRRASSAGLDAETKSALVDIRNGMRLTLQDQLPALKAQDASIEEMMAAVAAARESYDSQVVDLLDEEQLQAYQEADWWRSRQNRLVNHLTDTLKLNDQQKTQVDQVYAQMRLQIGDGFTLMGEGYIDNEVARSGSRALHEEYHNSLRRIFTPEQFQTYESNPDLRRHRRW